MTTKRTEELITLTLENAIEQYLLTLATEGKNPRYITWLKERLGYFTIFMHKTRGENYTLQDITIEDGIEFIKELMEWDVKYRDHPLIKPKKRKLAIQYIHGCGCSVSSFSSWASDKVAVLAEDLNIIPFWGPRT